MGNSKNSFTRSVKGKIIIAFLIAGAALFLAWSTSRVAFRQMLTTVETISSPNDKLTIVNNLYKGIIDLDQIHREMVIKDKKNFQDILLKKVSLIRISMDSLSSLYKHDPSQVSRIALMRKLLLDREQLFFDYLRVRDGIVDNKEFSGKLKSINGLVLDGSKKADTTTVQTTITKTSTTTFTNTQKEVQKGLFGRLFGKKKKATIPSEIVNEELNVKVDTIAVAQADSMVGKVEKVVLDMEKDHQLKSKQFVNNQAELAVAGNTLTTQLLSILNQVEQDVVRQASQSNIAARNVVNTSAYKMTIIIVGFFLITAILLGFILTDISKSNTYREELEIARDKAEYHGMAKQRFLANMSHEIRTPLQAIIGYAELIQKQEKPAQHDVEAIYQSSGHLLQIVNEVLDYSRIISGKFTFNNSVFNVSSLLNEVVSVMKIHAEKKNVELLTEYEISSNFIQGDPFRLKQILYNLLSNAIKFTDQGNITLTVLSKDHDGDSHFTFRVEDTGCGISEENIKLIFNEFEQGDVSVKVANSGTGLGLNIVKSLTEALGGRIYATSELNNGSCFTIYLKFAQAEEPVEIERDKILLKPHTGKVWLVDDDQFILQFCSAVFTKNNIEHVCFNSPQNLLATPWDPTVTCLLVDMRMPGMSGTDLSKLLRRTISADVKIVALTAQALPEEAEEILARGFDALLMKPVREIDLINVVYDQKMVSPAPLTVEYPNFDTLKKMTMGDDELMQRILERFIEDTLTDIAELQSDLWQTNTGSTRLILHRIAGRTAQVGSATLAADFRNLELLLSQSGKLGDNERTQVMNAITNLLALVRIVETEFLANPEILI